jgi:hypothetical protein
LRDLDNANPSFAQPKRMALIGAIVPVLLGVMCAVLASEATPRLPFLDNPITLFCLCLSLIALISVFIPTLFRWDWRAKFFGVSTIYLSSASLIGIVPWLCIVFYSTLQIWGKIALFAIYLGTLIWWCTRFIRHYRNIFDDRMLRDLLYLEEGDAVYYMQKTDNWILEKKLKLKQFPSNFVIVTFLFVGFLLVPFFRTLKEHTGLPFPHIFLAVATLPLTMMILGLSTRGYLVFYHYPMKIKKNTGKDVYIDMVNKSPSSNTL